MEATSEIMAAMRAWRRRIEEKSFIYHVPSRRLHLCWARMEPLERDAGARQLEEEAIWLLLKRDPKKRDATFSAIREIIPGRLFGCMGCGRTHLCQGGEKKWAGYHSHPTTTNDNGDSPDLADRDRCIVLVNGEGVQTCALSGRILDERAPLYADASDYDDALRVAHDLCTMDMNEHTRRQQLVQGAQWIYERMQFQDTSVLRDRAWRALESARLVARADRLLDRTGSAVAAAAESTSPPPRKRPRRIVVMDDGTIGGGSADLALRGEPAAERDTRYWLDHPNALMTIILAFDETTAGLFVDPRDTAKAVADAAAAAAAAEAAASDNRTRQALVTARSLKQARTLMSAKPDTSGSGGARHVFQLARALHRLDHSRTAALYTNLAWRQDTRPPDAWVRHVRDLLVAFDQWAAAAGSAGLGLGAQWAQRDLDGTVDTIARWYWLAGLARRVYQERAVTVVAAYLAVLQTSEHWMLDGTGRPWPLVCDRGAPAGAPAAEYAALVMACFTRETPGTVTAAVAPPRNGRRHRASASSSSSSADTIAATAAGRAAAAAAAAMPKRAPLSGWQAALARVPNISDKVLPFCPEEVRCTRRQVEETVRVFRRAIFERSTTTAPKAPASATAPVPGSVHAGPWFYGWFRNARQQCWPSVHAAAAAAAADASSSASLTSSEDYVSLWRGASVPVDQTLVYARMAEAKVARKRRRDEAFGHSSSSGGGDPAAAAAADPGRHLFY